MPVGARERALPSVSRSENTCSPNTWRPPCPFGLFEWTREPLRFQPEVKFVDPGIARLALFAHAEAVSSGRDFQTFVHDIGYGQIQRFRRRSPSHPVRPCLGRPTRVPRAFAADAGTYTLADNSRSIAVNAAATRWRDYSSLTLMLRNSTCSPRSP
jgi:hypothetical protein